MLRSLQLIVTPQRAWERIAEKQLNALIVLIGVGALFAVTAGLEAYSLELWGEDRGFSSVADISPALAARYAVAQAAFNLAALCLTGFLLMTVAQSFNFFTSFKPCVTVAAYGFSPFAWARLVDAVPGFPTWLTWGLGAALSATLLYSGVGVVIKPDQTKGFSLYMVSVILTWLTSGLAHFLAIGVLHRKLFA